MPLATISESFKTSDLSEGAAILTAGAKLIDLEKFSGGKFLFCFSPAAKAQAISEKFWRGELRQDPRELSLNIRDLKDRIFRTR